MQRRANASRCLLLSTDPEAKEQVEAHNAAPARCDVARGAAAAPRDARGDGRGAGLVAFLTLGRSRAENARDALADVSLVLAQAAGLG